MASQYLRMAISIAIRYSAVRRQFSPAYDVDGMVASNDGGKVVPVDSAEEWPVLEYPLQQYRLLPYLAAAYALSYFSKTFHAQFIEYTIMMLGGEKPAEM